MTIRERLEEDIIQAMRDRDKVRLEALRFLKAKVQDVEKPLGKTLDDQGMLDAISRQVSDRRDSIRMFELGGRDDLVAKESAELAILIPYRSEERRVGKECRSRWSPYPSKKKKKNHNTTS